MKQNCTVRLDVALAVAATGLVMYNLGLHRGSPAPGAAGPKIVSAQEFQVLGSSGEIRARLTTARDQPSLVLYGQDSRTPRALLAITPGGDPMFTLLGRDGKTPRLVANVTDGTPSSGSPAAVHIYDSAGKAVWSAP